MSVTIELSAREIKLGVLKFALLLTSVVVLIAVVISLLAEQGQSIAVGCLMISFSFTMLANGALAVTKVLDWFETRSAKQNG